tara:strand:- start:247 stop:519 length:273 start_codon:yes stop_codon:yes gene_type:complete
MNKDTNEILKILKSIIEDVLNKEIITFDVNMSAKDIEGWDSLTHVQIIYKCEIKFKLRFTLAELGSLKNVGDLVFIIKKHLDKKSGKNFF